jgi:hypothetical protein
MSSFMKSQSFLLQCLASGRETWDRRVREMFEAVAGAVGLVPEAR